MRVIKPGHNERGWTGEYQCRREAGDQRNTRTGCGATLEVTKRDIYVVLESGFSGTRNEARFVCPCCGLENAVPEPDRAFFRDLPPKNVWLLANQDVHQ